MRHTAKIPAWTWALPVAGLAFFGFAQGTAFGDGFASTSVGILTAALIFPLILGAVFAAVYHAEEVAHITGEPYGTLALTISVTVIELALIISLLLSGKSSPTLVRDTVFAVIMIVMTGLVGLCIVVGGVRYREQRFDVTSAKIYLAMLIVLAMLLLVLPNYTESAPGRLFSGRQLAFVSIVTIALYGVFLYTQTVLHRDYFIGERADTAPEDKSGTRLTAAIGMLVLALIAVILLAKLFAVVITAGVEAAGAPPAVTGVIIALVILTPEAIAAVNAAKRDELQKSLNLALGSSIATIGLTIPGMAAANTFLNTPLALGLDPRDTTLLAMTLATSIVTFATGRTNVLFGFLHLVLFGTFMFLVFEP